MNINIDAHGNGFMGARLVLNLYFESITESKTKIFIIIFYQRQHRLHNVSIDLKHLTLLILCKS